MEAQGIVQGAAARKYAGYTYREPVIARVNIWQLVDTERLHPACEVLQAVDLADYSVRVGATDSDGMSLVQVWVMPNEYTAAREPMLVLQSKVAHALTLRREFRDEALARSFREPHRHAGET